MRNRNRYRRVVIARPFITCLEWTCRFRTQEADEMAAHRHVEHRGVEVFQAMRIIEKNARILTDQGELTDADWATHEYAIEYRALMREWWTLPTKQTSEALAGTKQLMLTTKGYVHHSDMKDSVPKSHTAAWQKALAKARTVAGFWCVQFKEAA